MKKEPKIEVSFTKTLNPDYDFGMFQAKKHIKIDKKEWFEYVEARKNFEFLHCDLIKLAEKK